MYVQRVDPESFKLGDHIYSKYPTCLLFLVFRFQFRIFLFQSVNFLVQSINLQLENLKKDTKY